MNEKFDLEQALDTFTFDLRELDRDKHCLQGVLAIANRRVFIAIQALRDAQKYIQEKASVKPGWTSGDHDAFWALRKREEELMRERGETFVSLLQNFAGLEQIP